MPGNFQTVPLSVILSWPKPNYVDPVERTWMPAYGGTLLGVTTLLVVVRLWLRIRQQTGSLGWDDVFLILGYAFAVTLGVAAIVNSVKYSGGRHTWDVPISDFPSSLFLGWIGELSFILSAGFTKICVLLVYRRLAQGSVSKRWRMATIAAIAFTIVFSLVCLLVIAFSCDPVEAYWDSGNPFYTAKFTCHDTKPITPISGALSVVSDAYTAILPMGMLWNLDLTRRKRLAVNAIFALGLLVAGVGVVRTYYFNKLTYTYDLAWFGFDVLVWGQLESQLAIACACAPSLRVFFRRYMGHTANRTATLGATEEEEARCRSAGHSTASKQTFNTHRQPVRKSSIGLQLDDKAPAKTSLAAVEEADFDGRESDSSSQFTTMPVNRQSYAMQGLEKPSPPSHNRMISWDTMRDA